MRLRKASLAFLAALGVLVATARLSHADSVTYSTGIPSASTPFSTTFTLPKFDPSFGTLTGITLSLTADMNASITVINLTDVTQPFSDATATVPLTVTGPASTIVIASPTAGPLSGNALVGINSFPGLITSADNSVVLPSSAFAAYTGPGGSTATFTASTGFGTYSGSAVPNVAFSGSADVGGTVTILYTFIRGASNAPEPDALMLMGIGLASSAFLARCRRA